MKAAIIRMDPRAVGVAVADDPHAATFTVFLADGRAIIVPVTWFPRLNRATPEERKRVEITAGGRLIHWPSVDEDLWVSGLLATDEIVVPPDEDLCIDRGNLEDRAGSDS